MSDTKMSDMEIIEVLKNIIKDFNDDSSRFWNIADKYTKEIRDDKMKSIMKDIGFIYYDDDYIHSEIGYKLLDKFISLNPDDPEIGIIGELSTSLFWKDCEWN